MLTPMPLRPFAKPKFSTLQRVNVKARRLGPLFNRKYAGRTGTVAVMKHGQYSGQVLNTVVFLDGRQPVSGVFFDSELSAA